MPTFHIGGCGEQKEPRLHADIGKRKGVGGFGVELPNADFEVDVELGGKKP